MARRSSCKQTWWSKAHSQCSSCGTDILVPAKALVMDVVQRHNPSKCGAMGWPNLTHEHGQWCVPECSA
jgi:hypothetical protein